MNFPLPNKASLTHSNKVAKYIKKAIQTAGGQIPFSQFMLMVLYAPELGYYNTGQCKFDVTGDFTTAPELSPLFSRCIAKQCEQILREVSNGHILELGAGSGKMAIDILTTLAAFDALPQNYLIFEPSPVLKARQQVLFKDLCPQLLAHVTWLDALPKEPLRGVIIANEVMDAIPIHRFCITQDTIQEYYVTVTDDEFSWYLDTPSTKTLYHHVDKIKQKYLIDCEEYSSEINLELENWITALSQILEQGLILLIDYGYPQTEYYHPQRNQGTIQCYFRHHMHTDPLIFVGIQDITAHVDFSALAYFARNTNLEIAGYIHQGAFLLACGLDKFIDTDNPRERLQINNQVKLLTFPTEMGEIVKSIALTRNIKTDLIGFSLIDRRLQL